MANTNELNIENNATKNKQTSVKTANRVFNIFAISLCMKSGLVWEELSVDHDQLTTLSLDIVRSTLLVLTRFKQCSLYRCQKIPVET